MISVIKNIIVRQCGISGDRQDSGNKAAESPTRHGEEVEGTSWKKGNTMWQNIDLKI